MRRSSLERISPVWIYGLEENQVLVFRSNLAGRYTKGLSLMALEFGAEQGKGFGLSGQTFALPTRDKNMEHLDLDTVDIYIEGLFLFAREHRELTFLITEITDQFDLYEIAPLFLPFYSLDNCYLPGSYLKELKIGKWLTQKKS